jgi:hypothetical protein
MRADAILLFILASEMELLKELILCRIDRYDPAKQA